MATRKARSGSSDPNEMFAQQMKLRGVEGWEREFRFHPHRQFRFDFAWPTVRVAVEIEGGTFGRFCSVCKRSGGGRHTTGEGHRRDCEKYNDAAWLGWRVFRFETSLVRNGSAARYVSQFLSTLKANRANVESQEAGQGREPEGLQSAQAPDGHT